MKFICIHLLTREHKRRPAALLPTQWVKLHETKYAKLFTYAHLHTDILTCIRVHTHTQVFLRRMCRGKMHKNNKF